MINLGENTYIFVIQEGVGDTNVYKRQLEPLIDIGIFESDSEAAEIIDSMIEYVYCLLNSIPVL